MNYQPSDNGIIGTTQGICPVGWHIPTINEFDSLITGYAANDLRADGGNKTGFSALLGGFYSENGFQQIGGATQLVSSTILNNQVVELFIAGWTVMGPDPSASSLYSANYIRCIKDLPKGKL